MTSHQHKTYGSQKGKFFLSVTFITLITAALFIGGLFFMMEDTGQLDKKAQNTKANLRELAERYNFSGTEAVVDQGVSDRRLGSYASFKNYVEALTEKGDGYRHSVFDIIGAEVRSPKDTRIGFIYDIMVHRWSRKAMALILDDTDQFHTESLEALRFQKVLSQNPEGIAVLELVQNQTSNKPNLQDMETEKKNWMSMRQLRKGQVIDYDGKLVGKVDAVFFGDAEVQGIYVDLCSPLKQHQQKPFFLPFDKLQFTEGHDKRDVVLTQAQTHDLSRCLVPK